MNSKEIISQSICLNVEDIEVELEKGDNYNPLDGVDDVNYYAQKSTNIDPDSALLLLVL